MKFLQQLEGSRLQLVSREKAYSNVKFHERFGTFLEALRCENLITESERFTVERGYCWADDVRQDGILLITEDLPTITKQTKRLIVAGTPTLLQIFEHVLSRYATYCIEEDIEPSDIELDPQYHEKLNPTLWDEYEDEFRLKTDVRKALWEIAEQFLKNLKMPSMEIIDALFTGSNANYNWTDDSDIDLHIVVDVAQATRRYGDITPEYLQAKQRLWSEQHDIKIHGKPIEVYVQDVHEPHVSTGMYSLKEEQWATEPKHEQPTIHTVDVRTKAASLANRINDMTDHNCNPKRAEEMLDKLRIYRRAGLAKGGEFCVENLVFKYLRSNGYLEKLSQCKRQGFDSALSVEDEEWWKE